MSSKTRESFTITDSEILSGIKYDGAGWIEENGEEKELYEVVHEEETYHDLEKSYYRKDIVIKRHEDGKFFKGNFLMSVHHSDKSVGFTEVFPKQVTTTIYE